MAIAIIHLSDFHNIVGCYENHRAVIDAFFVDLEKQIDNIDSKDVFIAFSGDIAQKGDDENQYSDFLSIFDERLNSLGITKLKRICVPGNHDLSQKWVNDNFIVHEGVVSQKLDETAFNEFVLKAPNILTEKFTIYRKFENKFAAFGVGSEKSTGSGWNLTEETSIYCLNTAICSSGGLVKNGKSIEDKGRLQVDTRSIHEWLQKTKSKWKLLVMHHPLTWLSESSQQELKALLPRFTVTLHGHEHEQSKLHVIDSGKSHVQCFAPALYSSKRDRLGYAIIQIDESVGPTEIIYRQWTKFQTFVAGVDFTNNDSGKVQLIASVSLESKPGIKQSTDSVYKYLDKRWREALVSFPGQPAVWVNPIVKTKPEVERDEASIETIELNELIRNPVSSAIHSLPQFGLSCLAHFMIKEAWANHNHLWLYFDATELKPGTVKNATARELSEVGLAHSEVKCVVIDSMSNTTKDVWKIVAKIIEHFPNVPIVCMHTLEPTSISSERLSSHGIEMKFQSLYLWTLSRNHIRRIVSDYNDQHQVGDENSVITKIAADLEMLNLHRTPLNCLTLLKVSEYDFEDSPVNRSEMIKRVLFLLFNVDNLPTYKARPDLKDCEFVLGYFCENLIKKNVFTFSRRQFLETLQQCCRERYIDLEVQVVFDVLSMNNILICRDGEFGFRFSFWIYYFVALRMHHDEAFASYILTDFRYSSMPEVIEFYTGIDRQRDDALKVLTNDLASLRQQVEDKCGLPKNLDPYRLAQWTPSPAAIEKMQAEIEVGVRDSNLPAEIKDRFADQGYDLSRPYDQRVSIFAEQSVTCLMQTLRASSKALRNSDYVAPATKRALLEEILKCWEQLTMVLLVILPVLAEKGEAIFDGVAFVLDGNFGSTTKERLIGVLSEIPNNVVRWSKDDLHSQKMGPLLIDVFTKETIDLRKHELALLLISQRPRNWNEIIQDYITSIQKNSFYLLDVYRALRTQYRYSYASNPTLKEIEHLIRMAITKHVTGTKEPGVKLIQKTIPKLIGDPVIPPREVF